MAVCAISSCEFESKHVGKCPVHCHNDSAGNHDVKVYFNDFLIEYIWLEYQKSGSKIPIKKDLFKMHFLGENNPSTEQFLSSATINFNCFVFPLNGDPSFIDILASLNKLKKIMFNECHFSNSMIELEGIEVSFYMCKFHEDYIVSNKAELLSGISDSLYYDCDFLKKVSFEQTDFDRPRVIYQLPIFSDCNFFSSLNVNNIEMKAKFFLNSGKPTQAVTEFNLKNSIFSDKFLFNYYEVDLLSIKDTTFKNKVELKHNKLKSLQVENTNFEGLFDAYKSQFHSCKTLKSIFHDFTGFEKCEFGRKGDVSVEKVEFEYVTFLDFTNFRKAKFYNGLDLEHTNLKESPNFLNATIESINTNRETFRIIKHSFDKIGNQIEANKYFAYEMQAYDKELKKSGFSTERVIFSFNKRISNFGSCYIRPLAWMVVSVVLYNLSIWGYENNSLYEIYPSINDKIRFISFYANNFAKGIPPYGRFLKEGMEATTLLFHILFSIFAWHFIVAVKRRTKR